MQILAAGLMLFAANVVVLATDFLSPGLTPAQLLEKLGTDQAPLVVDVRTPAEFAIAHIPSAINIPVAELGGHLTELRHGNGVLIYCISGSRTRQAEAVLLGADIANISHLEGTFSAWLREKYPIEKGGVRKTGW